jgi:AGZA family xanthine/uracil permease-like MFS transporter
MMAQISGIDFDDLEVAIPAFLTMILMPFSFSITAGIGAGFVSFVLLKVVRRKAGQVHPLMWVVSALFVVYFAIGPLTDWLT